MEEELHAETTHNVITVSWHQNLINTTSNYACRKIMKGETP
jgi:hypothetical protein